MLLYKHVPLLTNLVFLTCSLHIFVFNLLLTFFFVLRCSFFVSSVCLLFISFEQRTRNVGYPELTLHAFPFVVRIYLYSLKGTFFMFSYFSSFLRHGGNMASLMFIYISIFIFGNAYTLCCAARQAHPIIYVCV